MIEDHAEEGLLSAAADTQVSIASIEPIASEIEASAPSAEDISLGNESYHIDSVLQEYREACQTGDLTKVKELIESGRIDISHDYDEKERISGLHWASINNRLGIVKYLIAKGANVDFQGGDLNATPLHWAARYGYVYIVDSLLESGADASLTDHQGFNLLHLSINSSNIMLVLYVLYFVVGDKLSVDCLDPNNRTPLLWAAYQGDSLSVKALLEFNANLNIADNGGFLPLHWATVKGQPTVLKYLLEGGSDFFQKTADNKDCFVISQEMHTQESFTNSLQESGFRKDGTPIMKLFRNPRHAKLITFIIPGLLVGLNLKLFATVNFFVAVTLSAIVGWGALQILKSLVIPSFSFRRGSHAFLKTPALAGILLGSIFWVFYVWVFRLLSATLSEEPLSNLIFLLLVSACTTAFFKLVFSDPGRISKDSDAQSVKATIKELLQAGKFDAKHFCINSYKKMPLRSKYSRFSTAIIARFDHFCPWIYNDVGLKNHKLFLFFLFSLISGVVAFTKVCLEYFDYLEDTSNIDFKCGIFDDEICAGFQLDPFAFLVMCWALLQAFWVTCLLSVQLFQTFKGITNYELNNSSRKRHNHDSANEYFTTTPIDLMDEEQLQSMNQPAAASEDLNNIPRQRTCGGTCCGLIGLDQVVLIFKGLFGTVQDRQPLSRPRRIKFQTDYGWKTNLKDFWLLSDVTAPIWQRLFFLQKNFKASLNGTEVDYQTLYTLPKSNISAEEMV